MTTAGPDTLHSFRFILLHSVKFCLLSTSEETGWEAPKWRSLCSVMQNLNSVRESGFYRKRESTVWWRSTLNIYLSPHSSFPLRSYTASSASRISSNSCFYTANNKYLTDISGNHSLTQQSSMQLDVGILCSHPANGTNGWTDRQVLLYVLLP